MKRELKEKDNLTESLREAATEKKRGGERQKGRPRKVKKCRRYAICVQNDFYVFARAVFDLVSDFAKLETSKLCFDCESVARSRKNRREIMGESGEGSVSVVAEKETVPRCSVQLASGMKSYTPSTEQGSDKFLKYVVERAIMEDSWKSIWGAGKSMGCVEEVAMDICLGRPMKQTLSDMVGV